MVTTTKKKSGSSLMDKIRAEQERIKKKKESSGGFEKVDWFKAAEGDNLVRILPGGEGEMPFRTVNLHYISIKKKDGSIAKGIPVRCWHDFERECPLCQAVKKLYEGSEKDKEKAKDLRSRETYIYNVINYKERKVQPYAAGITVHEEILNYLGDAGEEVFDLNEGHNWKITKKVDPRKPKNLGIKYSVRMDVKASAVPSKLQSLIETATDLNTLYEAEETDNIASYIEMLGFEDEIAVEGSEEEAPKKKAAAPAKKKAKVVEEEEEEEPEFEEEEEEEEEEVKPKKKAAPSPAPAKKKARVVEEEEEEEEEEPEFEEEEEEEEEKPVKKKTLASSKDSAAVKASKKKVVEEEEEEEEELDEDEDDLDAELRELGV